MRWRSRIDDTHRAIVGFLRQMGCSVTTIQSTEAGCPDLLVGRRGWTELVEVKATKGKVSDAQKEWHASWRGRPVTVLRSVDEAQAWLKGRDGA